MSIYNIEKIKYSNGNEVSICPDRGGIITSLKLKGKEIFYLDEATLNSSGPIRGGVPILFPNGGEIIENTLYPNLKRHGFARDSVWKFEKKNDGFVEELMSDFNTKDVYPFDFKLEVLGKFENNNSFTVQQKVYNTSNVDIPISMGLHPYFFVPDKEKKNIKFNFDGGREIEEKLEVWANGGTLYIDNPMVKDDNGTLEIESPTIGTITLNISKEYQKIWIWSQQGKDFICIEPMLKGLNGIIENPEMIKSKGVFTASFNIYLK